MKNVIYYGVFDLENNFESIITQDEIYDLNSDKFKAYQLEDKQFIVEVNKIISRLSFWEKIKLLFGN